MHDRGRRKIGGGLKFFGRGPRLGLKAFQFLGRSSMRSASSRRVYDIGQPLSNTNKHCAIVELAAKYRHASKEF